MSEVSIHRQSRRRFLKHATLALAAPAVVPASAVGADSQPAPSERVTLGMIGVGRQVCAYNLRRFVNLPDVQVVALCDVDRWRLAVTNDRVSNYYGGKGRCGPFGKVDRYVDFRKVIDRDDIDAVMISTPDHWHVPMAVMAAKAGKDVSLEKPIARSVAEGRLLVKVMKKYKRVFRMDSEFRAKPVLHKACALVRDGRIGKLKEMVVCVPRIAPLAPTQTEPAAVPKELNYDLWLGPAADKPYCLDRVHAREGYQRPGWIRNSEYNDGMVCNWGAHMLDIAQLAANTEQTCPVEVEAVSSEFGIGMWGNLHNFELRYRYANGVKMTFKSDDCYIKFIGEDGTISAKSFGGAVESDPPIIAKKTYRPGTAPIRRVSEERDFIDCVKSRKQTLVDAEAAHRVSSTAHIGLIAVKTGIGARLKYDVAKEQFTNNDEANKLLGLPVAREQWSYPKILGDV
ncbi:MAG: Gfo/Idh/MocA family oxidoreductase [Planctomycetota bacterium]|nr:Gfo/Idh/MocA family oxidoreductase [Planctomycetota bacterium]